MTQLCSHLDDLDKLHTQVWIISFGTHSAAKVWQEETNTPFRILLDPEREVYQAYGLDRSFLRSWSWKTIWRYSQLIAMGRQWRGIQGDSTQLGGDFIIDQYGIVQLAHPSHDPTDRPPITDISTMLRQLK